MAVIGGPVFVGGNTLCHMAYFNLGVRSFCYYSGKVWRGGGVEDRMNWL